MKSITIDECHQLLLSIAVEFDKICIKHRIPYYMLGGTMLGAVRHNGFIPWDDDMDFGVPRSFYNRLIQALSNELPSHLRVLTRENNEFAEFNYIKIDDTRTRLSDVWYDGKMALGIHIDIFPLDDGTKWPVCTYPFASYIAFLLRIKDYLAISPKKRKGFKKIIACALRCLFPLKTVWLLRFIAWCIQVFTAKYSKFYINYYGHWHTKEVVRKTIFGIPKVYDFAGHSFLGINNANSYLKKLYGNYMKLPPKKKRLVHVAEMYYDDSTENQIFPFH
ncbi:MAG: LicD family protein [Tannerella sp.]|jgi:lipopolysaccharide cholinephosphotransferase|nr:LicD family protein [Tannerella sp.]